MKNKILSMTALAALLLVMVASNVNAKSWRINHDPARKANFLSINDACASEEVEDGDVLYLDPGCELSEGQSVTKRLTIIGTGYFLTNQPYSIASVYSLYLYADGIKVVGLKGNSISINANDVVVERCNVDGIICGGQHAVIRQCYCKYIKGSTTSSTSTHNIGCTIENNIILGGANIQIISYLYCPIIRNNFIQCYNTYASTFRIYGITNATITDNIIWESSEYQRLFGELTNCTVTDNLLSCDESTYPEYSDNTCLGTTDLTSVFNCSGSNDHYYEMTDDSPAKAKEAGPFYGAHPYVFSGMPYRYPYYTAAKASARSKDNKIHITINTKVQNE